MLIREWNSSLEWQEEDQSSIRLWINLEIPRELWTTVGIGFSVSLFGTPLAMDDYTARMARMKFAKVCVEVKADFKFPEAVKVDLGTRIDAVKVVYKWRPDTCSQCLKFGHKLSNCTENSKGRGGNPSSVERRWQPVEMVQVHSQASAGTQPGHQTVVAEGGFVPSKSATVGNLSPVAWTCTNPTASGTVLEAGSVPSPSRNDDSGKTGKTGVVTEFTTTANCFEALVDEENELEVVEKIANAGIEMNSGRMVRATAESYGTNIKQALQVAAKDVTTNAELAPPLMVESVAAGQQEVTGTLNTLNNCLNLCEVAVDSARQATVGPKDSASVGPKDPASVGPRDPAIVDKGGTDPAAMAFDPSTFDPNKPETWTEAMRHADKEISLVMERMKNPEVVKASPRKLDLSVKLTRGNSGAPIRSSTRNKR